MERRYDFVIKVMSLDHSCFIIKKVAPNHSFFADC